MSYNPIMVFRGRLDGAETAVSLKDSSVSVAVGAGRVVAWDLGGRLYSIFHHGHTYRRGLNGRVLHKWRDPEAFPGAASAYDERQRVVLDDAEGDRLLDESSALAARAAVAMREHPGAWLPGACHSPLDPLDRCARFDARAARRDAEAFARVYSPVGILPPDQYMSVVLQATSGCSFGTCTFCDLYRDPYRVKTPVEFARHVEEVVGFLGESLSLRRRSIFLGAANALAIPTARLVDLLGVVHERFPGPPPAIHAFVDGFTGSIKGEDDYRRLSALGLQRVYIGLESGHDPLLAFVHKPGTSGQAIGTVRRIKAAGLAVAVIVMVGLGGRRFAPGHVADTVGALNAMRLGAGDLVYFSDLLEVPGTPYPGIAADAGLEPLATGERAAQLRAIRAGLAFPSAPPKFARYDIREFVY